MDTLGLSRHHVRVAPLQSTTAPMSAVPFGLDSRVVQPRAVILCLGLFHATRCSCELVPDKTFVQLLWDLVVYFLWYHHTFSHMIHPWMKHVAFNTILKEKYTHTLDGFEPV